MTRLTVDIVRTGPSKRIANVLRLRKPKAYDPANHPDGQFFVTEKLDGNRIVIAREEESVVAWSTQGIDVTHKLLNQAWFLRVREVLLNTFVGSLLDGELTDSSGERESIKTAMDLLGMLKFTVFATNMMTDFADFEELDDFVEEAFDLRTPQWDAVNSPSVRWEEHPLFNQRSEGLVFKTANYGEWYKVKAELTIDLIVTGIVRGQGKYEDQVGSLECSVYRGEGVRPTSVCNVSGMSDELRRQMSAMDIGRIAEVKYQRVGSAGRLQHPRFKQWRDDKAPRDCGAEQDPRLQQWWQSNSS